MLHDRLAQSLRHFGIDRNNYKVLKLLPLIYVGWAKGKIEPAKKERIVARAHDHFAIDDGEDWAARLGELGDGRNGAEPSAPAIIQQ